jgi:hypothetical protein
MAFFAFFFFFFFLDSTTFHSPPCCSRGSDSNWVSVMVRAGATGSCLGRALGVGRPPLRRSSMALMIEGPNSSTLLSGAARRALLSFCPFLGGRPDSEAETPHREHSWGALTAIPANSFRRTSFSSSSIDGLASASLWTPVLQAGPILLLAFSIIPAVSVPAAILRALILVPLRLDDVVATLMFSLTCDDHHGVDVSTRCRP